MGCKQRREELRRIQDLKNRQAHREVIIGWDNVDVVL